MLKTRENKPLYECFVNCYSAPNPLRPTIPLGSIDLCKRLVPFLGRFCSYQTGIFFMSTRQASWSSVDIALVVSKWQRDFCHCGVHGEERCNHQQSFTTASRQGRIGVKVLALRYKTFCKYVEFCIKPRNHEGHVKFTNIVWFQWWVEFYSFTD